MPMYITLFTATVLTLLAIQAEPITATIGYIWAIAHVGAAIKYWRDFYTD